MFATSYIVKYEYSRIVLCWRVDAMSLWIIASVLFLSEQSHDSSFRLRLVPASPPHTSRAGQQALRLGRLFPNRLSYWRIKSPGVRTQSSRTCTVCSHTRTESSRRQLTAVLVLIHPMQCYGGLSLSSILKFQISQSFTITLPSLTFSLPSPPPGLRSSLAGSASRSIISTATALRSTSIMRNTI